MSAPLRAGRRDGGVGDRRDAVAERGAAEDRAEQHRRMPARAGARRIQQRPADEHGAEAGAGRRRDERAHAGMRRLHTGRRAGRGARAPTRARRRSRVAASRLLNAPASSHAMIISITTGCAIPVEHRLGVARAVAGQQQSGHERRQQHRPEAALVGRALHGQPRHAGEEHAQRRERAGQCRRGTGAGSGDGRAYSTVRPGPSARVASPPGRRV